MKKIVVYLLILVVMGVFLNAGDMSYNRELMDSGSRYLLGAHMELTAALYAVRDGKLHGVDMDRLGKGITGTIDRLQHAAVMLEALRAHVRFLQTDPHYYDKLVHFDYETFGNNAGYLPEIYGNVKYYLGAGDPDSAISHMNQSSATILEGCENLQRLVIDNNVPGEIDFLEVRQMLAEAILFNLYVSDVLFNVDRNAPNDPGSLNDHELMVSGSGFLVRSYLELTSALNDSRGMDWEPFRTGINGSVELLQRAREAFGNLGQSTGEGVSQTNQSSIAILEGGTVFHTNQSSAAILEGGSVSHVKQSSAAILEGESVSHTNQSSAAILEWEGNPVGKLIDGKAPGFFGFFDKVYEHALAYLGAEDLGGTISYMMQSSAAILEGCEDLRGLLNSGKAPGKLDLLRLEKRFMEAVLFNQYVFDFCLLNL